MLILICPANAPELQWMSDGEKFLETVGTTWSTMLLAAKML